jgi:multidrug efflux system membrane fusion protein
MKPYASALMSFSFLMMLACREAPEDEIVSTPRPIKAVHIGERSEERVLSFSGTVIAADISDLSFAVQGRVASVEVSRGDVVHQGQVLAKLDPAPQILQVQSAEARLGESQARALQTKQDHDTTQMLYQNDIRSRSEFDRAVTELASARSRVEADEAALGLAKIQLSLSVITAPFDGVIAERNVEPFTDVGPGRTVLVLQSDNAVQVEVLVPARVIEAVTKNQSVSISSNLPSLRGRVYVGRVVEVARTGIQQSTGDFKPGMSAEATFRFRGEQVLGHLLLPINALLPEPGDEQSKLWRERNFRVFVYDPEAGSVHERTIRVAAGLLENKIAVTEGLSEGEIVATAGVHFLRDGQQVRVLEEHRP